MVEFPTVSAIRNQNEVLSQLEATVAELVRLGAKGDRRSVQALGRRLLTRPPHGANVPAFRIAIGEALASAGAPAGPLRGSSPTIPADEESGMSLIELETEPTSEPPILEIAARASVDAVIRERRARARLAASGLDPSSRILLLGPPGVGKSMTARYLAGALALPLVTVDLAAVVSSYLGKTGHNLRRVLDYARSFECVVLADEFDALAKRRNDDTDVGELKRIVNLLLMELDRWPASCLFVAASNHPELLDNAVERRFDVVVHLSLPSRPSRAEMFKAFSAPKGLQLTNETAELCALATDGYSGSTIGRLVESALREATLLQTHPDTLLLERALAALSADGLRTREERGRFATLAARQLNLSKRRIAELLGVTHPTVANLIAWYEGVSTNTQ